MTSRLRSLAGTAILALPLAATTAVIPAATAQAGTLCGPDQATVHFIDRTTACQSVGLQVYRGVLVTAVCTGPSVTALVVPGNGMAPIPPNFCGHYDGGEADTIVVSPG